MEVVLHEWEAEEIVGVTTEAEADFKSRQAEILGFLALHLQRIGLLG